MRVLIRPTTLTILVAVLLGGTGGQLLASVGTDDQIVIGNTGGTLSSIIRVNRALIIFGGGNARSDLADLLGRSTLPWRRQVDMLIIPGWDDQQALGALGLLERGDVNRVVILGQPSGTTVWTVLYQTASGHAVPVDIAIHPSQIEIGPGVSLELTTGERTAAGQTEFARLTLHFHAVQLAFLDASKDGIAAMNNAGAAPQRTHALVLSRAATGLATSSMLRLQPTAAHAGDLDLASSSYQRELGTGERITIGLAPNQLRLDLGAVKLTGATPTHATPLSD